MPSQLVEGLTLHRQGAHRPLLEAVKHMAKYPTERNQCYLWGYVMALMEAGILGRDAATFWRHLVGAMQSNLVDLDEVISYLD